MIQQLLSLSKIWCQARSLSAARLGTLVAGNSKFFDQVARPGGSCTVATFEKFLAFFRDPANWPEDVIPKDAAELLGKFANIGPGAAEAGDVHPFSQAAIA
jgi:hypothetical protein